MKGWRFMRRLLRRLCGLALAMAALVKSGFTQESLTWRQIRINSNLAASYLEAAGQLNLAVGPEGIQ